MGAVQKLATVVIVGLVALATILVVYLADEPTRRGDETTEQEDIALERGTALYITYCLQCHGPSGFGSAGNDDPMRVGLPLNQSFQPASYWEPNDKGEVPVRFQSDDPVQQDKAEAYLRYSITYGKPPDPRAGEKQMPAFGQELNGQQINDLIYLIMYGDWDYVYNEAVLTTGHNQAQADCDFEPQAPATPTAEELARKEEGCENAHNEEFALYPTAPATAASTDDAAASPEAAAEGGGILLEALDPYAWSQPNFTVKPGDTIQVVNSGFSEHDFTVDEWGINEGLSSEPVTITIPADAAPGDYEFYCSVPGHKEGGMVGTITVEAP